MAEKVPQCQYKECSKRGYKVAHHGEEDIFWAWLCFKHTIELQQHISRFWFEHVRYNIDGDC